MDYGAFCIGRALFPEEWSAYKSNPNDIGARNRIIEHYMPLVRRRAERIRAKLPHEIELDDLISAGSVGLIDAIRAFDPERGVKFETFCIPRVQGAMLDELRSMDWAPRMVRSKTSKLNEADKILVGKFGRRPTEEELANFLELPVDDVRQTMVESSRINMSSLDKKWNDPSGDGDVSEVDVLPDKRSLAMMMTIALRFIPTLLNETDRVLKAQLARGADLDRGSIVKRMKKLNRSYQYDF